MSAGGHGGGEDLAATLGLEGYRDVAEIGRGGFGVVYRAHQAHFNRTVAIKVLTGAAIDEDIARRFERERLALGALSAHPNIVTVYDAGSTAHGRPYLVMDHMAGGSLADRLRTGGPLGWEEAVEIGVVLAGALAHAHNAGVLHRDIKPENVMLSAFGEPQLGDFGIARIAGGTETRSGVITASIAHAAPEILNGQRPSVASDVYSLGSTIATLVLGRPPFARDTDEALQPLIVRALTEPPPDLRQHGVPHEVTSVLEWAMAKDPDERQASALAFGEGLRAAQEALGLVPTPIRADLTATDQSALRIDDIAAEAEAQAAAAAGAAAGAAAIGGADGGVLDQGEAAPVDEGEDGVGDPDPTEAVAPVPAEVTAGRGAAVPGPLPRDVTRRREVTGAGAGGQQTPWWRHRAVAVVGIAAVVGGAIGAMAFARTGGGEREPTAGPGSPSPTATASPTASPSPSPTASPTETASPTPSETPSPSPSPTGGTTGGTTGGSTAGGAATSGTTTGSGTGTATGTTGQTNRPPTAGSPSGSVAAGGTVTFSAGQLGSDPDGDPLSFSGPSSTSFGGSISYPGGSSIAYTAPGGKSGSDSFTYTVSDGTSQVSGTVTVTVTLANSPPSAKSPSITVPSGTSATLSAGQLASDPDGDSLTFSGPGTSSQGGRVTFGASITYTAPSGVQSGSDSFSYTVDDGKGGTASGRVSVTITSNNSPPAAGNDSASVAVGGQVTITVLCNDSDPDGDALTIANVGAPSSGSVSIVSGNCGQAIRYTHTGGGPTTDQFTYTISDGNGGSDSATVTVNVS